MPETIEVTPIEATPVPEAVDYALLYQEQKAENARITAIMQAARISGVPTAAPGADRRPAVTAAHVRASLGALALHNMSRDQKLQSLGIDPSSVTDAALKKIFGRGADSSIGKDLYSNNALQYKTLKQAALLLNLYGG